MEPPVSSNRRRYLPVGLTLATGRVRVAAAVVTGVPLLLILLLSHV